MRNPHFDEDARALVRRAQDRARVLRPPGLGTEHLLVAVASSRGRAAGVGCLSGGCHGGLDRGDLAQPSLLLSLGKAVDEVGVYLLQSW
jgi:hypothetical protein